MHLLTLWPKMNDLPTYFIGQIIMEISISDRHQHVFNTERAMVSNENYGLKMHCILTDSSYQLRIEHTIAQ